MKIALCIKQVPDTADIKWTENNTIQREGVESVINPFDTYAIETAVRLKEKIKDTHICGQFATDGDTAQTGPSIAQHLDIPQVTYVKEVTGYKDGILTVKREVEDGVEILNVKLPAVLCMLKCDYEPRRPLISGFIDAHKAKINSYSMEDIKLVPEEVGMKGSPTYVSKAFRPEQKQGGEVMTFDSAKEAAEFLAPTIKEYMVEEQIICKI